MSNLLHGEVTETVIGCFFDVHNILGFGFYESVYSAALTRDLTRAGLSVGREVLTPVSYRGEVVANYRMDLVVEGRVIVEVKSSRLLPPDSERQVYNYLRATSFEVGLLLHFGPKPKFSRVYLTADHKPASFATRSRIRSASASSVESV